MAEAWKLMQEDRNSLAVVVAMPWRSARVPGGRAALAAGMRPPRGDGRREAGHIVIGAASGLRLVCWYDDSVHQSPLQQSRITAAASRATVSRELGGDPTIPCNPEISTKRIFQSLRTTTDPSPTTKAPWPSPLTGAVLCRVLASSSK